MSVLGSLLSTGKSSGLRPQLTSVRLLATSPLPAVCPHGGERHRASSGSVYGGRKWPRTLVRL